MDRKVANIVPNGWPKEASPQSMTRDLAAVCVALFIVVMLFVVLAIVVVPLARPPAVPTEQRLLATSPPAWLGNVAGLRSGRPVASRSGR